MEKRQKWDFTDFVADRGEGQESDFSDPKIYPLNVTAYDAVRRYGGPEEGGWYYTSEEVIESIVVNSGAELDSATDKLFDKFSGSTDGLFRVYVEKEKGSQELKERPHYESKEVSGKTMKETKNSKIEYKIRRKVETGEWVVVVTVNGKRNEDKCYYTDTYEDAKDTMVMMKQNHEQGHQ